MLGKQKEGIQFLHARASDWQVKPFPTVLYIEKLQRRREQ